MAQPVGLGKLVPKGVIIKELWHERSKAQVHWWFAEEQIVVTIIVEKT